jgi:RHS repeat-associated protein
VHHRHSLPLRERHHADGVLWEIRRSSESPGENITSGGSYGTVSYTHAGGIDRPLVITKDDVSILPHQNWRGQFSSGTRPDGSRSDCPAGVTTNCIQIAWPGYRTTAWHHDAKEPDIRAWWGGLVDGMRDASGQQYMRNRYYDPATGQFTQPDPIGIVGGLNSYGFAAGDPVTYSDPYGLTPALCPPCDGSDAADVAVGFTPVASTIHDGVTLVSGRNPITGENVGVGGRFVAAIGLVTPASGGQIRGAGKAISLTRHAVHQAITRGVGPRAILDAFRRPLRVNPVRIDNQGRPSQRIMGREATVAQNPETGAVVSVNPTSTRRREKALRESGEEP